jgi:hypothetical protein
LEIWYYLRSFFNGSDYYSRPHHLGFELGRLFSHNLGIKYWASLVIDSPGFIVAGVIKGIDAGKGLLSVNNESGAAAKVKLFIQ